MPMDACGVSSGRIAEVLSLSVALMRDFAVMACACEPTGFYYRVVSEPPYWHGAWP